MHSANLRRKRQHEAGKQKKDEDASELQTIQDSQEFHLTLKKVFIMATAYLAGGAVLFSLWEDWSLFESFYYSFMTLSTIGKESKNYDGWSSTRLKTTLYKRVPWRSGESARLPMWPEFEGVFE